MELIWVGKCAWGCLSVDKRYHADQDSLQEGGCRSGRVCENVQEVPHESGKVRGEWSGSGMMYGELQEGPAGQGRYVRDSHRLREHHRLGKMGRLVCVRSAYKCSFLPSFFLVPAGK